MAKYLKRLTMKWDTLSFGGSAWKADVRMLSDLKDVVYDKKWFASEKDIPVYYMYRELYKTAKDKKVMETRNLRYDITIIPPLMLGEEYVKTAGHYHPPAEGQTLSYTEVYQVLEGEALYLLQKPEGEALADVVLVRAKVKDIVIIPPDYGHITINNSKKVLKMSNWVSSGFTSVYTPIQEKKGAAYYFLKEGVIKNPNYDNTPELRSTTPANPGTLGLSQGEDMYKLIGTPERLDFLNKPEKYPDKLRETLNK